jgi:hypothetical protein
VKPKLRVQQYDSAASFLRNSSKFLIQNETMNNLFWEVTKNWQFGKKINWAGSVFQNHKIGLSAIWMKTGYILLSKGKAEAIKRLVDYGRAKQWEIKGIMGAEKLSKSLAQGGRRRVRSLPKISLRDLLFMNLLVLIIQNYRKKW